ncbi:hypothetical protein PIB30_046162 [Stylosanthes scabra]|uniref:Secreted protein n=1 Tax=Stylosanthes scabra TaxID=79078 RepID=A0ABU6VEL1_9FABA|nr:hypothetical protein [Stylosanthes scabra]
MKGGGLRAQGFCRVLLIVAKPPILMAAVLLWYREDEGRVEGYRNRREVPPPLCELVRRVGSRTDNSDSGSAQLHTASTTTGETVSTATLGAAAMARARTRGDKDGKERKSPLPAAVGLEPTAVVDVAAWAVSTTTSMLASVEMVWVVRATSVGKSLKGGEGVTTNLIDSITSWLSIGSKPQSFLTPLPECALVGCLTDFNVIPECALVGCLADFNVTPSWPKLIFFHFNEWTKIL